MQMANAIIYSDEILKLFKDKNGLEIGGPSRIFLKEGRFPIYSLAQCIDGCNFSTYTIWEKEIKPGKTYNYQDEKLGNQYIEEATSLTNTIKNKYDFVISSNCFEHIANPLKALEEFKKVLKDKGLIVLILPRKESNFDHNRETTNYDHLLNDYNRNIGEDDLTHLQEILNKHDLSLDPLAGSLENFKSRSLKNFENRCLHQHIFNLSLLFQIFKNNGIETIYYVNNDTEYIIVGRIK